MDGFLRGQLAKLADVNIETLRYYEKNGLIPPPARSESGYRLYTCGIQTEGGWNMRSIVQTSAEKLQAIKTFLRKTRTNGKSIDQIRAEMDETAARWPEEPGLGRRPFN